MLEKRERERENIVEKSVSFRDVKSVVRSTLCVACYTNELNQVQGY